jgi:hypothetical protein
MVASEPLNGMSGRRLGTNYPNDNVLEWDESVELAKD